MSIERRKLAYFSLRLYDVCGKDSKVQVNPDLLKDVLAYVDSLPRQDRLYDMAQIHKCHMLDTFVDKFPISLLVFKSGKYRHRPPLLDKTTAVERDNPKTIDEGDAEKTHIGFKFKDDEIILVKEERKSGISIHNIVKYLSRYLKQYYKNIKKLPCHHKIESYIIVKDNFLEELKKMSTIKIGDAFVEKQILGSEYLNLAERLQEVRDEIVISIKAKSGKTIFETVEDFFNNFSIGESLIKRIRVSGSTELGDNILIDTNIIKKVEYLNSELEDITGVVNTPQILVQLENIAQAL